MGKKEVKGIGERRMEEKRGEEKAREGKKGYEREKRGV